MAAAWNVANAWWAADAAAAYAWRTADEHAPANAAAAVAWWTGDERAPADAAAAVDDAAVAAAIKDLKEQHQKVMAELQHRMRTEQQQELQVMYQTMLQLKELAIATRASLQEQLAQQHAMQQMFVASIAASQEQLAQQHNMMNEMQEELAQQRRLMDESHKMECDMHERMFLQLVGVAVPAPSMLMKQAAPMTHAAQAVPQQAPMQQQPVQQQQPAPMQPQQPIYATQQQQQLQQWPHPQLPGEPWWISLQGSWQGRYCLLCRLAWFGIYYFNCTYIFVFDLVQQEVR
jgi:hypothetical protein